MDTILTEASAATPIRLLFFLTILTVVPAAVICATSFLRTLIVLGFVRMSLGLQQMPPNQVLIALSLFLTYFVMGSTADQIYEGGVVPYLSGDIEEREFAKKVVGPLKAFMLSHTKDQDLTMMANLAQVPGSFSADSIPVRIVTPAFIVSELRMAFSIGFLLFVPFLVIDIAIAAMLNALGMIMLPPTVVALPFKLMIFVLADGWALVVGALVRSFGGIS